MKKAVLFKPTVLQLLVIFCVSLLLLLPQLFGRGLILGSDAVFHFNRFYETSQQIKEGNYQYFLPFMGFSNLDGSSMHCMSIFCVFSRGYWF
ncbi:hypothetical protein [Enterococcus gallinarum]|uniref:hypothetical protein n=1 Tax=Enterococcus gallinarum TaxID=1353 RepID=UPI000691D844|nr:hypothetical protein [Enterococcus gallinarum]